MGSIFGLPGMLFWGTAASIPILIHLFARQRYKKVPWAAMGFLLRAFKKTQRRIRLEHLLLLLLRILAILLFVLALADPKLNPGAIVGGLGDVPREVVVVIDNSYSMALTESDGRTPMVRAKEQIKKLIDDLQQERGDTVTLVLAGKPATLSLKGVSDLQRVRTAIEEVEVGDGATDLIGAFRSCVAALDDLQEGAEVFLFSDLQKIGFSPPSDAPKADDAETPNAGKPQQLLASLVQEIRAREATLNIVAPAGATTDNVAIVAIKKRSKAAVTGSPTAVTVTLRNFGGRPQGGVVRLFVDGATEPIDFRDIDAIPPGALYSVDFRHVFRTQGSHYVEARFFSDGLEKDNRRGLALEVRRKISALVVDGDPSPEPGESESFFFNAAMSPGSDRETDTEFDVEIVQEVTFDGKDLKAVDLLVLMDVALISTRRAEEIHSFVEEGGGLLIFVGDKTQPAMLNQRLWKNGSGVLPAGLRTAEGEDMFMELPFQITRPDLEHPALQYFSDPAVAPWLTDATPIYRYFRLEMGAEDPAIRVLASIDRPKAGLPAPEPLIVEKTTGKGRCVLIATAGGDENWGGMQALPTYLLLVRELSYFLTRREQRHENLAVGQSYERILKSFVREVVVSHDGEQLSVIKPLALEGDRGYELKTSSMDKAGIYRLDLQRRSGEESEGPNPIHVAVNVDPVEADLARVDEPYITASFPGEGVNVVSGVEDAEEAAAANRDGRAWWWALLLGAAVLALETALSQIFGLRARSSDA